MSPGGRSHSWALYCYLSACMSECMYVLRAGIFACMFIRSYVGMYVYMYMYVCIVYMYILRACMHACLYVDGYVFFLCTCMFIYMYTSMYLCMYANSQLQNFVPERLRQAKTLFQGDCTCTRKGLVRAARHLPRQTLVFPPHSKIFIKHIFVAFLFCPRATQVYMCDITDSYA